MDLYPEYKVRPIDIKPTVGLLRAMLPGKTRGGLLKAMQQFGLDFVGTQHRAFWDAYNTARLVWRIQGMVDLVTNIEHIQGRQ